jgi:hypothetical protein
VKRYGLWNGRQIRNAFQTAAALAYHKAGDEGPILTPNLFKEVAKTTDEFDKYINRVHGEKDEGQRAYDHVERVDRPTEEFGKLNRHTYATPQPATPVDPRKRIFSDQKFQEKRSRLEDSDYTSHGGLMEFSEHATYASSANSSRVFTETTGVPGSIHTSAGATRHTVSPSVTAKANRLLRMDQGQDYQRAIDLEDERQSGDWSGR